MRDRYPEIEPYDDGLLDVGDGNRVYWETSGNPDGKAAVVFHGGPGSGSSPGQRRLFDPDPYRIVLFDQRGCGRSTPHASEPGVDLSTNTTQHLLRDVELLRDALGIDEWLVFGGSWGSTLALAYAEEHPDRVSELMLWGVTTGRHSECDWIFRGVMSPLFPEQWHRLVTAFPGAEEDVIETYHRLLHDPDPEVCRRAAYEWCMWESATPDWPPATGLAEHFADERYALAFARLVIHYVHNDLFLEDGRLLADAHLLRGIQGTMVHGRWDLGAPLGNAWALQQVWPHAELVVVDNAGHSATPASVDAIVRATDRYARRTGQHPRGALPSS
jgi:proline iminopeptidase